MAQFKTGDVVHDADMGLGIVEFLLDPQLMDDAPGDVYSVRGVPGQSDDETWAAREGLLTLVTREVFERDMVLYHGADGRRARRGQR